MRGVVAGLVLVTLAATGAGAQQLAREKVIKQITNCRAIAGDNVDQSECYNQISGLLKAQITKIQATRTKELAGLKVNDYGGETNVKKFQSANVQAQASWQSLMNTECGALIEQSFYGGQAQGVYKQLCEINLLAARLDVMSAIAR